MGHGAVFSKSIADFKGFSTINAKAETLESKALWKRPFKRQRCIIPADGFYEWKRLSEKSKQPYAFSLRDGGTLALAGIWDAWKNPETDAWLQSFSIITTEANELMAPVHNRMPVILESANCDRWLSRENNEQPPVDLLRPYDADRMTSHPVDPRVGNVRNNEPSLCAVWECSPNSL